ncbi:MAG: carboxymuconolactone decarboxylase family protein [Gammaproteobacteria bacterium]
MLNLNPIRDRIPAYAKDLSLNLGSVLTTQGAPGLSQEQILGTALACAYASRDASITADFDQAVGDAVSPEIRDAARGAASLMGMNNIYYRFLHLAGDKDYMTMPARLRMNLLRDPGVSKEDFELYCLAVSAINGCGLCVESHEKTLRKAGVSREAIQSAVRIGAVVHAVSGVLAHPVGEAA